MKKTIALLLLTLLLAGCTVNSGETTETPTEPAQTQPLGYQPSEMEKQTRGGRKEKSRTLCCWRASPCFWMGQGT